MKTLIETARKFLYTTEEDIKLEERFLRLFGSTVHDLQKVTSRLNTFCNGQVNGNDFDEKEFNDIVNKLKGIKLDTKAFDSEDEVPVTYQYKKK